MATQLLVIVSLLLLSATVNGQTVRAPSGPVRPAPILTGGLERQLDQTPELLALAAETLTRVLVTVQGAQQTTALQEGVNANIDCLPWIRNFPGGSTQWLFQLRDFFGEPQGGLTQLASTERYMIGGSFDRWLNITSTLIAEGAEIPTRGDYICSVCIARGTPFQICHNATTTVHLLGAPPQLERGTGDLIRTTGGAVDVNIGDNVCINRTVTPRPTINLDCNLRSLDLNAEPPVRSAIPIPQRIWTFTDDEEDSETLEIYNVTDLQPPDVNPEFFAGIRALLDSSTLPAVDNFLAGISGRLVFSTLITGNISDDILPGLLPRRDTAFVQELVADLILGTYTCTVENVFGSDTATTVIRDCGEVAFLPGCPAQVIRPNVNNTAPVGCTVCIPFRSSVTLDCTVGGDNPMYMWTDSRNRTLSDQSTFSVSVPGMYTCNATNDDTPEGAVMSSEVRFAPEISFSGQIRSTNFGVRRDTGCERLNPPLINPPDLCVFVGEMVSFTCLDENNSPLNVTDGAGMRVNDRLIMDGSVTSMSFTCDAVMSDDPCSNVMPSLTVQVFDPARINRTSTLGANERGPGRSTSVEVVTTGDPVTLRCPIEGIEDPTGSWSFYFPPNAGGEVNIMQLDADSPGVTVMVNADDVAVQIDSFNRLIHGGVFVCNARNRAGSDQAYIILTDLDPDAVEWVPGGFGECNVECNGGSRVQSVVCRRLRDCNNRPNTECTDMRPNTMESCAMDFPNNCLLTPIFIAGNFGPCSEECKGGFRHRDVRCVVPMTGEEVPLDRCRWTNQREPVSTEFCSNRCCEDDFYPSACSRISTSLCRLPVIQQNCCWTCLLRVNQ